MNLEDLPWDDVIFKEIFNLLNFKDLMNLHEVSKKFQQLVNSYLEILKYFDFSTLHPSTFSIVLENCHNLKSINFSNCRWLRDSHIVYILKKNKQLKYLNINGCCELELKFFLDSICKNFISIKLKHCKITDEIMTNLVKNCPALETLDVRHCKQLTDNGILTLKFLTKLKKLYVNNCTEITERGLAPFRHKVKIDRYQRKICVARPLNLQV